MSTLVIPAYIDIASPDKTEWAAETPYGVFAFGTDFMDARQQLARNCAEALGVSLPAELEGDPVTEIRIMATTRKTFAVTDLLAETNNT